MGLQSTFFRGDIKLEQAAASDPAHIMVGAKGKHVEKIQTALNDLEGAALTPDGAYGAATAAAVHEFKKKRGILNYQGKIDDIVGRKTMTALDDEMFKLENSRRKGGGLNLNFKIDQVVPFSKAPMTLIQTFDDRVPSSKKNDLNETDPPIPRLSILEAQVVIFFDFQPTDVLAARMETELLVLAQGLGRQFFHLFKNNNTAGAQIKFPPEPRLVSHVEHTASFQTMDRGVQADLEAALKKQFATTGIVDVNVFEATVRGNNGRFGRPTLTNPAGVKTMVDYEIPRTEVALQAVIGGSWQGGKAVLKSFDVDVDNETYEGTIEYTLLDHFGVDNGDVLPIPPHGSPGQVSFWVLQHKRHPGFMPFITTCIIEKKITGRIT